MLREDKRARFVAEGGWLRRRHRFVAGRLVSDPLRPRDVQAAATAQIQRPVPVLEHESRRWWWFRDRFWWEDEGYSAADVRALVRERELRARRRLERAHAVVRRHESAAPRREPIARALRLEVWERDGGACVECGSGFDLQYDHVIPVALGGATSAANLQLLCGDCNRAKGAAL